jgi:hypothetical protein
LRQRRWMEFLEKYKCLINYQPGNANVVGDALSRKVRMVRLRVQEVRPVEEVLPMDVMWTKKRFLWVI